MGVGRFEIGALRPVTADVADEFVRRANRGAAVIGRVSVDADGNSLLPQSTQHEHIALQVLVSAKEIAIVRISRF